MREQAAVAALVVGKVDAAADALAALGQRRLEREHAGTVEHATHSNFNFTKYLDSATDNILLHCWGGTQIDKATVTCFRSDGSKTNEPVKYLEVIMEHVIISNYSISGGAGDVPIENISLDYGTIEYKYTPQGRDKGKAGTQVPIKHNLETREVS